MVRALEEVVVKAFCRTFQGYLDNQQESVFASACLRLCVCSPGCRCCSHESRSSSHGRGLPVPPQTLPPYTTMTVFRTTTLWSSTRDQRARGRTSMRGSRQSTILRRVKAQTRRFRRWQCHASCTRSTGTSGSSLASSHRSSSSVCTTRIFTTTLTIS